MHYLRKFKKQLVGATAILFVFVMAAMVMSGASKEELKAAQNFEVETTENVEATAVEESTLETAVSAKIDTAKKRLVASKMKKSYQFKEDLLIPPITKSKNNSSNSETQSEEITKAEEITEIKTYSNSNWGGQRLNNVVGRIQGPSGEETYYDLPMSGVIYLMRAVEGIYYDYWIRDDGCKMYGPYIMVAANLKLRPKGTIIETSLGTGMVCDTGSFAFVNPYQLDIATAWDTPRSQWNAKSSYTTQAPETDTETTAKVEETSSDLLSDPDSEQISELEPTELQDSSMELTHESIQTETTEILEESNVSEEAVETEAAQEELKEDTLN